MSDEGIILRAYIGSLSCSAIGKRTVRLDIPEDQAMAFMASMTLYGKFCEITIKEIPEGGE